jgi:hypothetical protein
LTAVEASSAALHNNPRDPFAVRDYNFALGRVFSILRESSLDPWTSQLRCRHLARGEISSHPSPSTQPPLATQDFDLIPADELVR